MTRYIHTNIIAKDSDKLIGFYKQVFDCRSIGESRNLRGAWLDLLTGISETHIVGEHLCLPGYEETHPTLEIFSYESMSGEMKHPINSYGFAHIAFEVDDVENTLEKVLACGGCMVGELVHADYEDGRKATFVYTRDPEGNIVELQSWSKCYKR
jgi:predicted enzyme related to lactoylglutathione lyase